MQQKAKIVYEHRNGKKVKDGQNKSHKNQGEAVINSYFRNLSNINLKVVHKRKSLRMDKNSLMDFLKEDQRNQKWSKYH